MTRSVPVATLLPASAESTTAVAFVIPAFNEARLIAETIASIHTAMRSISAYEVIVVDNGSTDDTVQLAQRAGARTLVDPHATVAGLRNLGVRAASAEVIVFLDADVALTGAWTDNIRATLSDLAANPRLITGSWCGVPDNPSWIERFWFAPKAAGGNNHINSGHMVLCRAFFDEIGGFDPDLQTGEDYELSVRATTAGGDMREAPGLAVVHHGYPRSLAAFVRREIWHGRSDFTSVRAVVRSRVAVATVVFLALHLFAIVSFALHAPVAGIGALLGVAGLCMAAAAWQFRRDGLPVILVDSALYYFYFLGRTAALLSATVSRNTFVPRDRR